MTTCGARRYKKPGRVRPTQCEFKNNLSGRALLIIRTRHIGEMRSSSSRGVGKEDISRHDASTRGSIGTDTERFDPEHVGADMKIGRERLRASGPSTTCVAAHWYLTAKDMDPRWTGR